MGKIAIPVEISARHCHISANDLHILFGKEYMLTPMKQLSQPGQFAAEEIVTIENNGNKIQNVRILGPVRSQTQVELSATDTRKLHLDAPIRVSGKLYKSAPVRLVGPIGSLTIKEGAIIAARHLHCDQKSAAKLELHDQQIISLKTIGPRAITFHNVVVRIGPKFSLSFHLDTDEGNAAFGITKATKAYIV